MPAHAETVKEGAHEQVAVVGAAVTVGAGNGTYDGAGVANRHSRLPLL